MPVPWKILVTNPPPGGMNPIAASRTRVESSSEIVWSVSYRPVRFGEMSLTTTFSSRSPKISRIRVMVPSSVMSPMMMLAPSTGDVANRSTPITKPSFPTSSAATWAHPPGWQPTSSTASPGRMIPKRS
uniref:Uncharacterized protein n=3 Tax=environmental samples TaxID=68359 RepID=A0A075FQ28_9EURY|nr:hypothetical protein [uncultured marine group II/III euryarchaeote AD1000_39_H06]AIE95292.1 hypothetical protein [uncultured marine group II/III euryarchaeote AD1000_63_B07]AIF05529.1 hypothetical protein [uncultured marine group II/III euryarchaeote KM3_183_H08]